MAEDPGPAVERVARVAEAVDKKGLPAEAEAEPDPVVAERVARAAGAADKTGLPAKPDPVVVAEGVARAAGAANGIGLPAVVEPAEAEVSADGGEGAEVSAAVVAAAGVRVAEADA